MTRRVVYFNDLGPSAMRGVSKDESGYLLVLLEEDEVADVKLDLTSFLETGETISSVTLTANNITAANAIAGDSLSTTLTLEDAKGYGEVTVAITTSSSKVWRDKIRVRNKRRFSVPIRTSDYGQAEDGEF